MWKLIATAIAVADNGSMSISTVASDFVDRASCEYASGQLFSGTVERELAGRRITIRTAGQCVPGAPPATIPLPFFGPVVR